MTQRVAHLEWRHGPLGRPAPPAVSQAIIADGAGHQTHGRMRQEERTRPEAVAPVSGVCLTPVPDTTASLLRVDAGSPRIRGANPDAARKDLGKRGLYLSHRALRFGQRTLGVEQHVAVPTRQPGAIVVSV